MSVLFPLVPNVPGVPPVLRAVTQAENAAATVSDVLNALGFGAAQFVWGVFTSLGSVALTGDSVVAVDYRSERRLATSPIEGGQLGAYNKVQVPFDLAVTFTKGGSVADRNAFLKSAESILASLDLFTVATPEWSYVDVNCVHLDMRRTTQSGATLLTVELGFNLLRTTAPASFTNTQTPAGAAAQNTGPVQPQTPTPAQAAAAASISGPVGS